MSFPKIRGETMSLARVVGEAKVRALKNVDSPYLSASGPGFLSRKSGSFSDVDLEGVGGAVELEAPNLISFGRAYGASRAFYTTTKNDKFVPKADDLPKMRISSGSGLLDVNFHTATRYLGGNFAFVGARVEFPTTFEGISEDSFWRGEGSSVEYTVFEAPAFGIFTRPVGDASEKVLLSAGTVAAKRPARGDEYFFTNTIVITGKKYAYDRLRGKPYLYAASSQRDFLTLPPPPEGYNTFSATLLTATQLAPDWLVFAVYVSYERATPPHLTEGGGTFIYDSQDYGRTWTNRSSFLEDVFGDDVRLPSNTRVVFLPKTPDEFLALTFDTRGSGGSRFCVVTRAWGPTLSSYVPRSIGLDTSNTGIDICLQGVRAFQTIPTGLHSDAAVYITLSTDEGLTWVSKEVPYTRLPPPEAGNAVRRAALKKLAVVFPLGKRTWGYVRYEEEGHVYTLMVTKDLGDTWHDWCIVSKGWQPTVSTTSTRADHTTVAMIGSPQFPARKVTPIPWLRSNTSPYEKDLWEGV